VWIGFRALKLKFQSLRESSAFPQGDHRASGVVLRRKDGTVSSQELLLFLRTHGATWVSAPGADGPRNRFGAGTEPMMWGEFRLYQSPRRLYLKGVEVREDFWNIRRSPAALRTAVKWCGKLAARLMPGVEDDSLLSLLWGSMKNLSNGLRPLLLDIRFAWRWGNLWGVAPPLDSCVSCGARMNGGPDALRRTSEGFLCGDCSGRSGAEEAEDAASRPFTAPAFAALRNSATLPLDKFSAWASDAGICDSELSGCPPWLYSFLSYLP
jgi:DNA repair protein RecO (recombination protein O)